MDSSERESTVTSLLRSIGSLGNTSGRGLLMFRTLAVATSTAAVVGLCSAYIGGIFAFGGGHIFLFGSWVGSVSSSMFYYRSQITQAFQAFDNYPELMRLHLMMNFPVMGFHSMDLRPGFRERERARMRQSWPLTSMLAAAFQTAHPSIEDILLRREQIMINDLVQEADNAQAELKG